VAVAHGGQHLATGPARPGIRPRVTSSPRPQTVLERLAVAPFTARWGERR
jgi:hypothetical protein